MSEDNLEQPHAHPFVFSTTESTLPIYPLTISNEAREIAREVFKTCVTPESVALALNSAMEKLRKENEELKKTLSKLSADNLTNAVAAYAELQKQVPLRDKIQTLTARVKELEEQVEILKATIPVTL
jgi:cell division protein FtsB